MKNLENLKPKLMGTANRIIVFLKEKVFYSKKRTIIFIACLLLILVGAFFAFKLLFGGSIQAAFTENTVQKSDIQVVVSGSGTVEPINKYNIVALVQGDVVYANFEEGDKVTKGQLLYEINSDDMEATLSKAMISLEKSALSFKQTAESYNNLSVKAEISGKVGEVFVARNDSISQGSKIAIVYDDSYFSLKVPFNSTDAKKLKVGQKVNVVIDTTFETIPGTITKVYDSERVLEGSQTVTDIEISIKNPGALKGGTYGTVNVNGISSYEGGALSYLKEKTITASASGTIDQILCTEGQYVKASSVLAKINSDTVTNQFKSESLSMQDAQLSFENTKKQLDNYNITAPIDGTIIEKTIKAGDILDTSSSSQTILAVIADMSTMTFEIPVDELDIAKIKEGQKVDITVDALPDSKFTGVVNNVGINGASQDGVTSYPVKVVIDKPDGILPGMNVSADIVVESATNVLSIPVSAVHRGNLVYVKDDGTKKAFVAASGKGKGQGTGNTGVAVVIPNGFISVQVELGISDDSYIEIKSGLSEGDTILVPVEQTTTTTTTTNQQGGFPGAGGGTRPPGGYPGG